MEEEEETAITFLLPEAGGAIVAASRGGEEVLRFRPTAKRSGVTVKPLSALFQRRRKFNFLNGCRDMSCV